MEEGLSMTEAYRQFADGLTRYTASVGMTAVRLPDRSKEELEAHNRGVEAHFNRLFGPHGLEGDAASHGGA